MANLKVASGVSSKTYGDNILPLVGMILPFAGGIPSYSLYSVAAAQTLTYTTGTKIINVQPGYPIPNLGLRYRIVFNAPTPPYMIGTVTSKTSSSFTIDIDTVVGSGSTTTTVAIQLETPGAIPSGWLLCNGSTFSSSTYPQLYSLLGSTTLPDLREKYLLGYDSSASARTVGSNVSSSHSHTITYPANNPVNATAFVTTSSTDNHSHGIAYNGIAADGNGNHAHNAAINSYTTGLTNTGNYSQAAPTNAPVSTGNHGHNFGYGFAYSTAGGHSHNINAVNSASQAPTHTHNYTTSNSGTIASATTFLPSTVYVNFIVKAG